MKDKFTIEDFLIKIIPGGILLGVLYFLYGTEVNIDIPQGLDVFVTTIFLVFAFLTGEIIQTIAYEFEWLIDIFYKFYRPSQLFLYKNNPVLKNEKIREKIIEYLSPSEKEKKLFDTEYKKLPVFLKRPKQEISQSYFWKLYSNVNNEPIINVFNRNYLYIRAIVFLFAILTLLFLVNDYSQLFYLCIVLFIIFLWRARGMARMLVFKIVILNLKGK
ncbi:hypothetical protein ACSSWA_09875 [Melioribacter sp. Ez-97]|uniref:hypothetical protein n=1 Tax=Melioribacter sp. Ez-97 TaxID=3423434 RepID=UPI003ED8836B